MAEDQELTLPPLEERPLVTFALFAYNQEEYIREAVEGAFAQTYEPLEIILSDDCSTDRTFEIMEEMVAGYQGPHLVRLERTPTNLGGETFGLRVSSLLVQANGELIVLGAGDDISHPARTTLLFKTWNDNCRKAVCIHSKVQPINEEGKPFGPEVGDNRLGGLSLDKYILQDGYGLIGATNAISKSLMERFPPLPSVLLLEDGALGFRALLSDGILFVDQALVKYRRHDRNLTNQGELEEKGALQKFVRNATGQHSCYLGDYLLKQKTFDPEVIKAISKRLNDIALISHLHEYNLIERCKASIAYSRRLPFKRRAWLLLHTLGLV